MVDSFGFPIYNNGGTLSNPSGDGHNFIWSESGFSDVLLTVVRNREGTVKGFKDQEFFIQFETDDQAIYLTTVNGLRY